VPRDNKYGQRINERITAPFVRLVGDNIPNPGCILRVHEALRKAEELELDLVEIVPTADPPVCRIIDFQKFLYEQKRKLKEQKAKTNKVVIKDIRFGPNTDEHDFNFKKAHTLKFLQEGAKVKASVFFKGRTIFFKEKGEILLLQLAAEVEEFGKPESLPKLEGKRMTMYIIPKKSKK